MWVWKRRVKFPPHCVQVFDPVMLQAGAEAGMIGNFHGDELNPMLSGVLAEETKSRAVSHLEHVSQRDIEAMARAHVFGVLLPTTAFVLRIKPPPARALIDAGAHFCGSDAA